MEDYGFEDAKDFHPMNQRLGAIFFRVGLLGEGQGFILKGKKISLSEIGDRIDRIRLRVQPVSLGIYFYSLLFERLGSV